MPSSILEIDHFGSKFPISATGLMDRSDKEKANTEPAVYVPT